MRIIAANYALSAGESLMVMRHFGYVPKGLDLYDDREMTIALGTCLAALDKQDAEEAEAMIQAIAHKKRWSRTNLA